MSVARLSSGDTNQDPKRARAELPLVMGFSNEDKIGTIQPHDYALVITLRIRGYDVKRVMVDQGSAAKMMYPDLYKGLNLKVEDLTPYSSPLVSFEGKIYFSERSSQITHTNWFGGGEGRFYCCGCILSLYSNCCQTLASYLGSSFFHSAPEG